MFSHQTPLNFGPLTSTIQFLMEIDKLKLIERRNKVLGNHRHENSAEHSWHVAMTAMSLAPFAAVEVNMSRVIAMALLHDIVEIDAGDILVFDLAARAANVQKEQAAAVRLFGLLPAEIGGHYMALWQEYEAGETADAKFTLMVDRIIPMLMNLHNNGQSWVAHGISYQQVVDRAHYIADVNPELWLYLDNNLKKAQQQGWLK